MSANIREELKQKIITTEIEDREMEARDRAHLEMPVASILENLFHLFKKYPDSARGFQSALAEVHGYYGDLEFSESFTPDEIPVARTGSRFVRAFYHFLGALGCPAEARDWALAICALSDGDSSRDHIITNEQICRFMGYGRTAMIEKRESFLSWQNSKNWRLIDYKENDRDGGTLHWLPTEYRPVMLPFVVRFYHTLSGMPGFDRDPVRFLEDSHAPEINELANALAVDFEDAPILRRRKNKEAERNAAKAGSSANGAGRQQSFAYADTEEVLTGLLIKKVDEIRRLGGSPVQVFGVVWEHLTRYIAETEA